MRAQKRYFPLRYASLAAVLLAVAMACNLTGRGEQPTAAPTPIPPPTRAAAPTAVPAQPAEATAVPTASLAGPEEAIVILEPGPGSRLTSPLRVAGLADPTFEQALGVRLVLDDGSEIAAGPATIAAELGSRGPFEAELALTVAGERNALLQVYSSSARDGGITHLASVGVTLAPGGSPVIEPAAPSPEAIHLLSPEPGAELSGGTVLVEGVGLASFEGTLVVEIYDAGGTRIAAQPLIVEAPDIGLPGTFSVTVAYSVSSDGPGRVVVVDPLPAFDGIGHIASVEVTLRP